MCQFGQPVDVVHGVAGKIISEPGKMVRLPLGDFICIVHDLKLVRVPNCGPDAYPRRDALPKTAAVALAHCFASSLNPLCKEGPYTGSRELQSLPLGSEANS